MKRIVSAAGHRSGLVVTLLALLALTAAVRPVGAVTFITASGPFILNKPGERYFLATNLKFQGDGLKITANNVDLELAGHTISGLPPTFRDGPPPETVGIQVFVASTVTIRGGRITDFFTNVELINGTACNLISLNTSKGTNIDGNHRGIFLNSSNFNHVLGCFANGCQQGILVAGERNVVESNTADQCVISGIVLRSAIGNTIARNSTNGSFLAGIELQPGATNTLVLANTSTHNGRGISLDEAANQNILQGNFCLNNLNGIWVENFSGSNSIAGNVALHNAIFDLNDFNQACDHNVWSANRVLPGVTANQPCIH